MRNIITYLFISSLILSCCKRNETEMEYKVYNDVFMEIIGTDLYHVPYPTLLNNDSIAIELLNDDYHIDGLELINMFTDSLPLTEYELQGVLKNQNSKKIRDSIQKVLAARFNDEYLITSNRPLDNRKLIIVIMDSLAIPEYEISDLKNWRRLDQRIDSTLILSLINKPKVETDLNKINNTGRYQLISTTEHRRLKRTNYYKENEENVNIVAFLFLSRVSIDSKKNIGCFYSQRIDPGGHGHGGYINVVKKIKGKWHLLN